jgi:dihydropteroate synthase
MSEESGMKTYYRPLLTTDPALLETSLCLGGGWTWFNQVESMDRLGNHKVISAKDLPKVVLDRLTSARADIAGISMQLPKIMGILNLTPDSFSDGGQFDSPDQAVARAKAMAAEGADLLDLGGESTRPGADLLSEEEEVRRTLPVIAALQGQGLPPVSIDTRKAAVAKAALLAGASLVNDVAALTFDPKLGPLVAAAKVPVCLMHAQGDPKTMQTLPTYDNVLLEVYDWLEKQIEYAESLGIARDQIVIDPGIGFGKTVEHNLALLRGVALFHSLGCPILIGASRKRFIGVIGNAQEPAERVPGSIALAMAAVSQGVQFIRVHDIAATKQALRLWQAVTGASGHGN